MAKNVKNSSELTLNSAYELIHEEYLDDIKSAGMYFRHKKSGAHVCLLSNDDDNKMFCAAFRTPPKDSTGVPHIIEHTVLCGSKKYPARDPFMQLAKGSLNTFLNAMTYPDKTLYPVASCNDKDFANLMNVYMDAVFYPNIYKYRQIFMQEGWHYELENADDELKINGIVYSEMKGATSSPDRMIWESISAHLYPDTTYGVNSGGDPEEIPSLSYEQYLDFHRKYYHPSNSYIIVYGDCDMDERLKWMDENYLSAFDEIEVDSSIDLQPHVGSSEPLRFTESYSVGSDDETEGKTFLAFAALGGSNLDVFECRAWHVLSSVLLNSDGAPIKQALLDAGIGEDIFGGYDSHMREDMFAVIAKNANSDDEEKFYRIIMDTLKKQVEDGISEKAILAYINRQEFNFREADYGSYPRGLDYAVTILQSWLYDDNAVFDYLHVLDDFDELRKRIGTGYYEGLVKKYLIDTDHSVLVKLVPERGLVEKNEEKLRESLAEYKASLSREEIDRIVKDTAALREYQLHEPTVEELNCIPSLTRSDIPRETAPYCNEERVIGGYKTVFHDVETNGITYASIYFDIADIPKKYVPYVGLLSELLGRMDTDSHTYADLSVDIKMNMGELTFGTSTIRKYRKNDEYRSLFGIYTRMMPDQIEFALKTAAEIIRSTKFEDKKRLKSLLREERADQKREIMSRGNAVAAARARSYYSETDTYLQYLSGIDYYLFLSELVNDFDKRADEIASDIRRVTEYIFDPSKMIISLACDAKGLDELERLLPVFGDELSKLDHTPLGESGGFIPVKKNEGIKIPSQIQFVAQCGNLNQADEKYHGAMQVVKTAVNADYLYQQVRVKGGAYGCGCRIGSDSGNVQYTSYRDPKLGETYEVYRGMGDYVRSAKLDESELTKYIIGTFSAFDRPESAYDKAARSFMAYVSGKTTDDLLREREEMLDITEGQFRECGKIFDEIAAQDYICAIGNEKKIADNAQLFGEIITIN